MKKIITCAFLLQSVCAWPFSQSFSVDRRDVALLHAHIKGKHLHGKGNHIGLSHNLAI